MRVIYTLAYLLFAWPLITWAEAPQTSIQRHYGDLQALQQSFTTESDQQRAKLITSKYDALLSPFQNKHSIAIIGTQDLKALYAAAHLGAFYSFRTKYLADMHLDLDELAKRHVASPYEYAEMYRALVGARRFAEARAFLALHPSLDVSEAPVIRDEANSAFSQPTILIVSPGKNELTRQEIKLDRHAQIVVVGHPLCHFTQFAGKALEADPQLRRILREHSIWISPQDGDLDVSDFQQWNREHPDLPLAIVWKQSEWSKIDYWGTPTFYFFKNGTLVDKVAGWSEEGNRAALIAAMRKAGLLH